MQTQLAEQPSRTSRIYSGIGTSAGRGRDLIVRASLLDMPGRERTREKAQAIGINVGLMGGVAASRGAVATPLTIITSTSVKLWLDSALGAGANTWTDQSANGYLFTEPTNPPALTTLGGVPCYQGDGIAKRLRCATFPITAVSWIWIIARPISWSGTGSLCGSRTAANAAIIYETGSTPNMVPFNGTGGPGNAGGVAGSWYCYEMLGGTGAADYLNIGSTLGTTGYSGSDSDTGWDLFCRLGANFGNYAIAGVVFCGAKPTTPEITNLKAWGHARWPAVQFAP